MKIFHTSNRIKSTTFGVPINEITIKFIKFKNPAYKSGMLSQDQHSDGLRASRGEPISTLGQSKGFLPLGEF